MNAWLVALSISVLMVIFGVQFAIGARAHVLRTPQGDPFVRCAIRVGWRNISILQGRLELRDGTIRVTRLGRHRLLMDPIPAAEIVRLERGRGPRSVWIVATGRAPFQIWTSRRRVAIAFFAEAGVSVAERSAAAGA